MFIEIVNHFDGRPTTKQARFGFGDNNRKNTSGDHGNKLNIYFCCKSSFSNYEINK